MKENPDKVPYLLNHYSKGPSYPEVYWKEILENNNIKFEPEYRVVLYSLDFKIGMIDLEIDGEQHYVDSKIIESDIRRNKFLEELGFTIIRVRWKTFRLLPKEDRTNYVNEIISRLRD